VQTSPRQKIKETKQMASRREFLQMGIAALALPIRAQSPDPSCPSAEDGSSSTPIYKMVYDERFSASRAFAEEASRLGLSVYGIKGDMTDLWYHDLDARWKQGPAAIAGMTAHGAIFCLERLAWDKRMRVVFRADHRFLPDGSIEHALSGPSSMLRQAVGLNRETDWAQQMAGLVTRCPATRFEASLANVLGPAVKYADDPEHLISWLIAPVLRA
jgi:hypothetical protein